jgi:hypothetical protein
MTKKTNIKIVTIILIISSIVLMVISILDFIKTDSEEELFILTNDNFDLNEFINKTTLSKKYFSNEITTSKFTSILFINSDDCNPCKKNLINFSNFLEKNKKKYNTNQIIIIKDTNQKKALWFSNTLRVNVPKLCGDDQQYMAQFERYGDSQNTRQLILVDNARKKIRARVKIVRNNLLSNEKLEAIFNKITNLD